MIACPRCGSTESLGFDWKGVVTARIENGEFKYVYAGGVFGVSPDTVNCGGCDNELYVPDELGQTVVELLNKQGFNDDGWDLPAHRPEGKA